MRSLLWNGAASACEAARLRASLALDGDLEEIHLLLLRRHLDRCPECLELVGGMRAAATTMRSAPPEPRPFPAVVRRRAARRRLPWPSIAVAVATLAVGSMALPRMAAPTGTPDDAPRLAAPPPRLPIGQRSAGDDFLASSRARRQS